MCKPHPIAVLIAALALLGPRSLHATETAGIDKAQGLIEFHAGNFPAALVSFEQANRDDRNSPLSHAIGRTS